MDVSNIGKSKKPEITPNNFAPNNEAQLNADLWNADNPNNGNDTVSSDLDLPAELTKPIISDDSQPVKKPEKKQIHIQEGCNYQAGFGCRWYIEVPNYTYEGLKIYRNGICDSLALSTVLTRFLEGEGILIADPTRPLKYIINDNYKNNRSYPEDAIKFLDDDDGKDLQRNSLNLSPTTSRKLQEYINKHGEEAILKLLSDEKEK